jgi:hypothetical protein
LVKLRTNEFDIIAPALLAMFNAQRTLTDDMVEATLAARLGSRGAAALPLLERLIFSNPRRPMSAALYGLCRVGAEAAPLAERIAALATPDNQRPREHDTAIFVALLRMGHDDIVEREKAASARFTRINARVLQRKISPASPPDVCVSAHNWPNVQS